MKKTPVDVEGFLIQPLTNGDITQLSMAIKEESKIFIYDHDQSYSKNLWLCSIEAFLENYFKSNNEIPNQDFWKSPEINKLVNDIRNEQWSICKQTKKFVCQEWENLNKSPKTSTHVYEFLTPQFIFSCDLYFEATKPLYVITELESLFRSTEESKDGVIITIDYLLDRIREIQKYWDWDKNKYLLPEWLIKHNDAEFAQLGLTVQILENHLTKLLSAGELVAKKKDPSTDINNYLSIKETNNKRLKELWLNLVERGYFSTANPENIFFLFQFSGLDPLAYHLQLNWNTSLFVYLIYQLKRKSYIIDESWQTKLGQGQIITKNNLPLTQSNISTVLNRITDPRTPVIPKEAHIVDSLLLD